MIYLWALGVIFLFVILVLVFGILVETAWSLLVRLFRGKDQKQRPLFNLSIIEFTAIFLILGFFFTILFAAVNQARYSANEEILLPEFTPLNPAKGWTQGMALGFPALVSIIAALTCISLLSLIRYLLPEKLKPYITWKKWKDNSVKEKVPGSPECNSG